MGVQTRQIQEADTAQRIQGLRSTRTPYCRTRPLSRHHSDRLWRPRYRIAWTFLGLKSTVTIIYYSITAEGMHECRLCVSEGYWAGLYCPAFISRDNRYLPSEHTSPSADNNSNRFQVCTFMYSHHGSWVIVGFIFCRSLSYEETFRQPSSQPQTVSTHT